MRYIIVQLLALTSLSACDGGEKTRLQPPLALTEVKAREAALAASAAALEIANELESCKSRRAERIAEYKKLIGRKEYWPATLEIRRCAEILDDKALKKLVAEGEIKSYIQDLEIRSGSIYDQLRSAEAFSRDYPEQAKKYSKLLSSLRTDLARQANDTERQRRMDQVPPIGSTTAFIINESWGYPSKVNETITARGVKEQWVYRDGRYLYFENKILVAVQK